MMFPSNPLYWQKNTVEMYGSRPVYSPSQKKLPPKEAVLQDRNMTVVILQFLDENWELIKYTRVCKIWSHTIKNFPFASKTFMNDVKILCLRLEKGLSETSEGRNYDYPFALVFNQKYRFVSWYFRAEEIPLMKNYSGENFFLPMYIRYRFWPANFNDAFYLDTSEFSAKFQKHPRCPEKAQQIMNCLNSLGRQAREKANLLKIRNWLYVMNNGLANQPLIIEQYF